MQEEVQDISGKHFPTFKRHWDGFTPFSKNLIKVFPIALLLLSVFLTVNLAGQQQNANSNAQTTESMGIYGTAFGMDTLANMQVGGNASNTSNTYVAYRFKATQTSNLQSIRLYIVNQLHSGYGAGTGGTLKIDIVPEANGVPSSNILGTTNIIHPADAFQTYTFSSPVPVTQGTVYDIVFTNTDPSPTANFVSVDLTYTYQKTSPTQPTFADSDFGALRKFEGGSWSIVPGYTPIVDLAYSNGSHQGQGYMEVELGNPAYIGGDNTPRERFTISGGDKTVTAAYARVARTSGTGTMTMRLENSDGTLIDSCTIDSSAIPIYTATGDNASGNWYSCNFTSPQTLKNGQTYNFRLTATNNLWSRGIQKGDSYGYNPSTYFTDGYLQISTNGGTSWSTVSGLGTSGDLQFYFQTTSATTSNPMPTNSSSTPTNSPTPTQKLTSTPTPTIKPTTTPTLKPTATPTPKPTSAPTPTNKPIFTPTPTQIPIQTSTSTFYITSGPSTVDVNMSQATVKWGLSNYGTGQVSYGITSNYGQSTTPETSFNWNYHIQTISGLSPATTYHFKVTSKDSSGHVVVSSDNTFTTASPTPTPTPTKKCRKVWIFNICS